MIWTTDYTDGTDWEKAMKFAAAMMLIRPENPQPPDLHSSSV